MKSAAKQSTLTIGEKFKYIVTGKYPAKTKAVPEQKKEEVQKEKPKATKKSKKSGSSFGDSLKFLITGVKKKPSAQKQKEDTAEKSVENTEKQTQNIFAEEEKPSISPDDAFLSATHMTLSQACEKIEKWSAQGEENKVAQGKKLILQYFPDHVFSENKTVFAESQPERQEKKEIQEIAQASALIQSAESMEQEVDERTEFEEVEEREETGEISEVSNDEYEYEYEYEDKDEEGNEEIQEPENALTKTLLSVGITESAFTADTKNLLPEPNDINDDERVFAAISYVPFLSFFVIATRKDSPFVSYHAWQGFTILVLFLASLPIYFLLSFIPGMGFLFWLMYLIIFGVSFLAAWNAWTGKYITLPGVSMFAQKFSGHA